jgi:hypothetical protein
MRKRVEHILILHGAKQGCERFKAKTAYRCYLQPSVFLTNARREGRFDGLPCTVSATVARYSKPSYSLEAFRTDFNCADRSGYFSA